MDKEIKQQVFVTPFMMWNQQLQETISMTSSSTYAAAEHHQKSLRTQPQNPYSSLEHFFFCLQIALKNKMQKGAANQHTTLDLT